MTMPRSVPRRAPAARAARAALVVLLLGAAPAAAIPPDGTYYDACAAGGGGAPGTVEARLAFPELCFAGTCCALSNPTRLRLLDAQFLYDAACVDGNGAESEARVFFGDGAETDSMVVFLFGRAETLTTCTDDPEGDAP